MTMLIDVLPTLLDYAEIDIPLGVQGKSLRAPLEGSAQSWRDFAFSECAQVKMICTHEWKLIRYGIQEEGGQPYSELYDRLSDPGELYNCYHKPDCRAAREMMEQRLLDFLISAQDPLPAPAFEDPQGKEAFSCYPCWNVHE